MRKPQLFLLALCLVTTPALAQLRSTAIAHPNIKAEAQAARELSAIAPAIINGRDINTSDIQKMTLALAFAQLGRLDAGLRITNTMSEQTHLYLRSRSYVRDEIYHVGAKRRALIDDIKGSQLLAAKIDNNLTQADSLCAIARAQTRIGATKAAQETLHQALKLVEATPLKQIGVDAISAQTQRNTAIEAQMYIAVLLARAGAPDSARQVLERTGKTVPTVIKFSQPNGVAYSMRREFLAWSYFQIGDIEKSAQITSQSEDNRIDQLFPALLRIRRFDMAEKLARQQKEPSLQLSNLLFIAWFMRPTDPERAKALAHEVNERLHDLPPQPEMQSQGKNYPSVIDAALVNLAAFYRDMGDEANATKLFDELKVRATPSALVSLRFGFASAPLAIYSSWITPTMANDSPVRLVSRERVRRAVNDITALLTEIRAPEYDMILPGIATAQIGIGDTKQARQTLQRYEAIWLSQKRSNDGRPATDPMQLWPAISVAQSWKQLGDNARVTQWLDKTWSAPMARLIPPRERAVKFITSGFINVGKKHLLALGIKPEEETIQYKSLAYYEGLANPTGVPIWLANMREPAKKLNLLNDFAKGLTEEFIRPRSEREFSFSSSGFGSSPSYEFSS